MNSPQVLILFLSFVFINCASETKKADLYSRIKSDPIFEEYINRFKMDNKIFSDQSIYFDKLKKKYYLKCYGELFPSKSCDFNDHESCNEISHDREFLAILENKCKKGKLMIELKEKYPEMDKTLVAKLIEGSYENGLAAEMLKIKINGKNEK